MASGSFGPLAAARNTASSEANRVAGWGRQSPGTPWSVSLGGASKEEIGPPIASRGSPIAIWTSRIKFEGSRIKLGTSRIKLEGLEIKLGRPGIKLGPPRIKLEGPGVKLGRPRVQFGGLLLEFEASQAEWAAPKRNSTAPEWPQTAPVRPLEPARWSVEPPSAAPIASPSAHRRSVLGLRSPLYHRPGRRPWTASPPQNPGTVKLLPLSAGPRPRRNGAARRAQRSGPG
jgi:hypothetical protein